MAINGTAANGLTHTAAVELVQNSCSPLHLLIKRIVRDKKYVQQAEGESNAMVNVVNISNNVRPNEKS